jgi:hypothetical protein
LGVVNHSLTITQVSNAQRNASLVELGIVGDELPTPKVPSLKTVSRFQKAKGMQFYSFVEFHQTQFYVPRGRTTKTIMCIKKNRPQETVVRIAVLKILNFQIGNFLIWHHARTMSSKCNTDGCHGPKTFHNPPDPQHGNLKVSEPKWNSTFNKKSVSNLGLQNVSYGSMNSPLNTDFWTWPVAVRGVLAMNFPSYTGSKKNHHAG